MSLKSVVSELFSTKDKESKITNGNAYVLNKEIDAKNNFLMNTTYTKNSEIITSAILAEIDKIFTKTDYIYWYLLNFQANYFANLFHVSAKDFNDIHIFKIFQVVKRIGFLYGNCAVYKLANKAIPMQILKCTKNIVGEYDYIELGFISSTIGTTEQVLDSYIQERIIIKGSDEISKKVVVYQFNTWGIGAIVWLSPFIYKQKDLLTMVDLDSFSYIKKFEYSGDNPDILTNEIKNYFNVNLPFVLNVSGIRDKLSPNRFRIIEGQENLNTNTGMIPIINYYNQFLNIYYDLFGRRYNTDKKVERNVSAEVDASQDNFDILQRDIKVNLTLFIVELNNLFGTNLEIL